MNKPSVTFRDLWTIPYKAAWDYQEKLMQENLDVKAYNRNLADSGEEGQPRSTHNYLLFCEHPAVYTLGKSGHLENLLVNNEMLKAQGIEFFKTNRGGDITFHGPEQIVGYPVLDLELFFTDLGRYMRALEEIIIRTIAEYGIKGGRLEGSTGVWIDEDNPAKARKICALGVKCSRWVTMHGFALNVNTDLKYFDMIVPCGITDKGVTSLEKELGRKVSQEEVKQKLMHHFAEVFQVEWATTSK